MQLVSLSAARSDLDTAAFRKMVEEARAKYAPNACVDEAKCAEFMKHIEYVRIDDPIGAVPVHLVCGIWGTVSLGLFATGQFGLPSPTGMDASVSVKGLSDPVKPYSVTGPAQIPAETGSSCPVPPAAA